MKRLIILVAAPLLLGACHLKPLPMAVPRPVERPMQHADPAHAHSNHAHHAHDAGKERPHRKIPPQDDPQAPATPS